MSFRKEPLRIFGNMYGVVKGFNVSSVAMYLINEMIFSFNKDGKWKYREKIMTYFEILVKVNILCYFKNSCSKTKQKQKIKKKAQWKIMKCYWSYSRIIVD